MLSEFFAKTSNYLGASFSGHPVIANICLFMCAYIICFLSHFFARRALIRGLKYFLQKKVSCDETTGQHLIFIASRLSLVVPAVIIYVTSRIMIQMNLFPWVIFTVRKLCLLCMVFCIASALNRFLSLSEYLYSKNPNAVNRPIKGIIQLSQIFIITGAFIMAASMLLDKSPIFLLSGLGAIAAVLMLVFQDTILSLVSGFQLSSNNMIKIGDWIVLPSESVDGNIVEIALHTIKVQNWDKTIVTIPTRKLTESTFINYRGMFESGGRRIKRSLNIDMRSIRFLDDEEISSLKDFVLLDDYLNEKNMEIESWNNNLSARGAKPINGRRITNIGTFRIYAERYLRSLKTVNQDMMLLVRQLPPDTCGLPLEVYCFANTTTWVEYEKIQSDIFDHLISILPVFGLRVFQDCSDIYQECDTVRSVVGGVYPHEHFVPPIYPSDKK